MTLRKSLVAGTLLALAIAGARLAHPAVALRADEAKPAAKHEPWKSEDVVFEEFAFQMRIVIDNH